ncbi:unnamed protein product [Ectocarpus sp. 8 AP-2014]
MNFNRSGGGNNGLGIGRVTLWLCVVSSHFNLDSFTMEAVLPPTPSPSHEEEAFGGIPAVIPGPIQAEDFDGGGEGVGYSDTDTPNNGGAYRLEEGVDISAMGSQHAYNVGWTRPGEFLRYTVTVEEAGEVEAPPAYHNSGSFHVVTGGTGCDDFTTDLSGLVTVPSTGGWESFASLSM